MDTIYGEDEEVTLRHTKEASRLGRTIDREIDVEISCISTYLIAKSELTPCQGLRENPSPSPPPTPPVLPKVPHERNQCGSIIQRTRKSSSLLISYPLALTLLHAELRNSNIQSVHQVPVCQNCTIRKRFKINEDK